MAYYYYIIAFVINCFELCFKRLHFGEEAVDVHSHRLILQTLIIVRFKIN